MRLRPALSMPMGAIAAVIIVACISHQLRAQTLRLDPAKMPRIATVDEHFQSYNIEMVEVIGGQFWKPYSSQKFDNAKSQSS